MMPALMYGRAPPKTHLGMVYLKSRGMRKIGVGGLYVKLSAQVLGVSHT